jgi:hypothetical protein
MCVYLKRDFEGGPLAFCLTGGEASDSLHFAPPDVTPRTVLADQGYDAKANSPAPRKRGIAPTIAHKAMSLPAFFPKMARPDRADRWQALPLQSHHFTM